MAHRLTGTASTGPDLPGPGAGSESSAILLGARARALLDAGDVDGYRALHVSAAKLADPNRRYHAQVVLLELGLAVAATWRSERSIALRMAVADAAVEALEAQPSEPVLLNAAAAALYELGSLEAARDLVGAVRRLDPAFADGDEHVAAVRGPRQASPTQMAHPALASLARRARLVAGRAQPGRGLTLSLCMIVRDEESMLARCLAAAAPAVDEIVVVDTGSRDATIQIARSFGARVIEHAWTDSFSEARNISLEAAAGDWLMCLDADQVLASEDVEALRALTGHTWREAFYLVETSHMGEANNVYTVTNNRLRIFRNRPEYRYTGRVHEKISPSLPLYAPRRVEQSAVRLEHYGYLKSILDAKGKAQRNIRLLRVEVEANPSDAFLRFSLGSEHAAAGDDDAALLEFERARAIIVAEHDDSKHADVLPELIARLVRELRRGGRLVDAAALATEGLRRYPTFTDLVIAQANMAAASGAYHEARELYRRCVELGDAPARYGPLIGCGTYLPRIGLAGLEMIAGDYEAARQLLLWCIENHPDIPGIVQPYATALLGCGLRPDDAVTDIERRFRPVTSTVRFTLGSALADAGAPEAAERQYRLAAASRPAGAVE